MKGLRRSVALLATILLPTTALAAERRYVGARTPADADAPPLSKAVLVGDTLYLSGELGLLPGRKVPATAEEEARRVLENVKASLAGAGMTLDDLVSVQVFCSDVAHFDAWNRVYRAAFTREFPARAFVGSGPLLFGARFEMQGIAVRREAPKAPAAPAAGVVRHGPGVAPHPELDALYGRFAAAYRALDAAAAADVYAEDVAYLVPDAPLVKGRAEAAAGFARFFDSLRKAGKTATLSFEVVSRGTFPDGGWDVGVFTLVTGREGEAPSTLRGKFVVVARKDADGLYRWKVDAYNGLGPAQRP